MPSSRRRFFLRAALFLIVFILIAQALGFALSPAQSFTRLMLHDLYAQKGEIDIAFVGASHALFGFDTETIDKELELNAFNLGSASQKAMDSYYLLREMFRDNRPKTVVIELTYAMYTKFSGYDNPLSSMILFDYYRVGTNKLAYFSDAFAPSDYAEALLLCYRYRDNFPKIFDTLRRKLTSGYLSFDPAASSYENEKYVKKGFVAHEGGFEEGGMGRVTPYRWDEGNLNETELDYLGRMIRLCEEKGAKVVLVSTPMPMATLLTLGKYDEVHAYFNRIASEYGVAYFDFNLAKPELFVRADGYYFDTNHLCGTGASAFSKALCGVLSDYQRGESPSGLFYESFAQAKGAYAEVANVYLQTALSGDTLSLSAKAYYGDDVVPEYRFLYRENGLEEYKVLRDFADDPTAAMATMPGRKLEIRVEARAKGTTRIVFDVYAVAE